MQVLQLGWVSAEKGVTQGVHGDHVGSHDQRVPVGHVAQAAAGGAVPHEHAGSIEHDERRLHHVGEVGYDAVNVLVKLVASAAEQAVPVLHRHRSTAQVVVLAGRDSDDLGGLLEGAVEHRPGAQHLAVDLERLESARLGEHEFGPHVLGRALDARLEEAAFRLVDGVVGHDDPTCTGLPAEPCHGLEHLGAGGCTQDGRPIEGDVGLEDNHIALLDEGPHAPHLPERRTHHRVGIPSSGDRHVHRAWPPVHRKGLEPFSADISLVAEMFRAAARVVEPRGTQPRSRHGEPGDSGAPEEVPALYRFAFHSALRYGF